MRHTVHGVIYTFLSYNLFHEMPISVKDFKFYILYNQGFQIFLLYKVRLYYARHVFSIVHQDSIHLFPCLECIQNMFEVFGEKPRWSTDPQSMVRERSVSAGSSMGEYATIDLVGWAMDGPCCIQILMCNVVGLPQIR
jgi:hypothetical protein